MKTKTGWQFLISLHSVCNFTSRERSGLASNSEMKRWCQQSALRINGNPVKWDEQIPFPDEIESVTLFTKQSKITLL